MRLRFIRLDDPWANRVMSVGIRTGAVPLPTRKLFEFLASFAPASLVSGETGQSNG